MCSLGVIPAMHVVRQYTHHAYQVVDACISSPLTRNTCSPTSTQVADANDPHAFLVRPLPTNTARMANMAVYGRRTLLGVQVESPARYRWLRALQYAFLVTRSKLVDTAHQHGCVPDAGAHHGSVHLGPDCGYSPNRSFFGSTVIGPMVRLGFSAGQLQSDPAQLMITVCCWVFM